MIEREKKRAKIVENMQLNVRRETVIMKTCQIAIMHLAFSSLQQLNRLTYASKFENQRAFRELAATKDKLLKKQLVILDEEFFRL